MQRKQYATRASLLLAAAGVFMIAAQGVSAAKVHAANYTAVAQLLIERQPPHVLRSETDKETKDEFECFRATQMQLIKSRMVIQAALRNSKVKYLPSFQREDAKHHLTPWLTDAIQVRCPDNRTGMITVSLTSGDSNEAAALVNAVVQAYMEEVVNVERMHMREKYDALQRIYAEKEDEVRLKREQLKHEQEAIGPSSSGDKLEGQLLTQHALFCQCKLDESNDERHRIELQIRAQKAGGDDKQVQQQLAALTERSEACAKDLEQTRARAESLGKGSISVEMQKDSLRNVEDILRRVGRERELLKIELTARPRVNIVGDKSSPAAVPENPD